MGGGGVWCNQGSVPALGHVRLATGFFSQGRSVRLGVLFPEILAWLRFFLIWRAHPFQDVHPFQDGALGIEMS